MQLPATSNDGLVFRFELEDERVPGSVVTFYSYKGGTGRTMALVNIAGLLAPRVARKGRRVLAIDMDLEAPGLHHYFARNTALMSDDQPGMIDWLEQLRDAALQRVETGTGGLSYDTCRELLEASDFERHVVATGVDGLDVIKAGRFADGDYATRVNRFGWEALYRSAPPLFGAMAEWLGRRYAFTFIDSRTGVTDVSGICTMLLPDTLAVVFTPNAQSLTGIGKLVEQAAAYRRQSSADLRPLQVYPLVSRVEGQREDLRGLWRFGGESPMFGRVEGFQPQFEALLRRCCGADGDLSAYFGAIQVPHSPDYAYGERTVFDEFALDDSLSLRQNYEAFLPWIAAGVPPWKSAHDVQKRLRFQLDLQALASIGPGRIDRAAATALGTLLAQVQRELPPPPEELAEAQALIALGWLNEGEFAHAKDALRRLLELPEDGLLLIGAPVLQALAEVPQRWHEAGETFKTKLSEVEAFELLSDAARVLARAVGEEAQVHRQLIDGRRDWLSSSKPTPYAVTPPEADPRSSLADPARPNPEIPTMRAFIIRGFGQKKDSSGAVVDFDEVERALIRPAMQRCALSGGTTGEVTEAGNIRADMFALILEADLVICDITVHNANVFYELGVRHALRKKRTLLIKGSPSADTTPFDLSTDRYVAYDVKDPAGALDRLSAAINTSLASERETDSPIFLMMPGLAEADASKVTVVPLTFIGEVQRAEVVRDRGWLRLLASDVRGERFQWDGLKLVGRAQWNVKDYDGARDTWEAVRRTYPNDLQANLALANVYERIYRQTRAADLLEASNQAIRAVLDQPGLEHKDEAEALALQGRNLKTLWRRGFEGCASVAERRERALDRQLLQSFEAYRRAFFVDLNAFYPGLACLQAGVILQSLAQSPTAWRKLVGTDARKASRFAEDLEHDLAMLRQVVGAAITRAKERAQGDELMWTEISGADLAFLTEPEELLASDPSIAIETYRSVIPPHSLFAWDAARGQLQLFADLGIRAEAARAVIQAFDAQDTASGAAKAAPSRPVHLVVFTGHTPDLPGAASRRFPAAAQGTARMLIRDALMALKNDDEELVVLASAAPGADILAHEACREAGIPVVLCLPMPAPDIARDVFARYDDWLGRFFEIVRQHERKALTLGGAADAPRWMPGRPLDAWERGNRWVLELALAWGAGRCTLLALWDMDESDASRAGTAQMVRLARATGRFDIRPIDSRQLTT